jgi:hypothetical protein
VRPPGALRRQSQNQFHEQEIGELRCLKEFGERGKVQPFRHRALRRNPGELRRQLR